MPIGFITLKMVFICAWTSGDASNLSCQSLYQEAALTVGETQLSPTVCIS